MPRKFIDPMSQPIVICFDMDGTLLDGSGNMHPNDRAILKSDRKHIFIPATGRSLGAVRRLFQKNQLFKHSPLPIPVILQNGSLVYLPGEELHAYRSFPPETQDRLLAAMLAEPELNFWLFGENILHTLWPTPFGQSLSEHFDLEIQPFPHDGPPAQYSKIIAISEDLNQLADFARKPALDGVELSYSRTTLLEINPSGVNKGTALVDLLEALGVEQPELYVAGDGGNDLPLFKLSEHSFAPLDAQPQVRARARHVIDTQKEGLLTPILRLAGKIPGG
jgi:Cof subfamily protein (haloacid dehalogenase superfamily)